MMILPYLKG